MGRHFMSFSFFPAWHVFKYYLLNLLTEYISFTIVNYMT